MIPLNRIVHDAHAKPELDLTQRIFDGLLAAETAQETHAGAHSHRDVYGVPGFELRPANMRHSGRGAVLRLAASAFALTAATGELHLELLHEFDLAPIRFSIA